MIHNIYIKAFNLKSLVYNHKYAKTGLLYQIDLYSTYETSLQGSNLEDALPAAKSLKEQLANNGNKYFFGKPTYADYALATSFFSLKYPNLQPEVKDFDELLE